MNHGQWFNNYECKQTHSTFDVSAWWWFSRSNIGSRHESPSTPAALVHTILIAHLTCWSVIGCISVPAQICNIFWMKIVTNLAWPKSPVRSDQYGNWWANPPGQNTGKCVDKSSIVGRLRMYGCSAGVKSSQRASKQLILNFEKTWVHTNLMMEDICLLRLWLESIGSMLNIFVKRRYWWELFETIYVGYKFEMLLGDKR